MQVSTFSVIMSKKKTYLKPYVDFIITDAVEKFQCIFCSKVPGNDSMKPSIL